MKFNPVNVVYKPVQPGIRFGFNVKKEIKEGGGLRRFRGGQWGIQKRLSASLIETLDF